MPRLRSLLCCLLLLLLGASFAFAQAGPDGVALAGRRSVAEGFSDSGNAMKEVRERLYRRWRQDADAALRSRRKVKLEADRAQRRTGMMVPVSGGNPYVYFPTSAANDSRFLVLAGAQGTGTLTNGITIKLSTPSGAGSLDLAIFDGDFSGAWDQGSGVITYSLWEDGDADGQADPGESQISQWLGSAMTDNSWATLNASGAVNTGLAVNPGAYPAAGSPSGNHFFRLVIQLSNPSSGALNCFKVRTSGSIRLEPQDSFNLIAELGSMADVNAVYPAYPSLSPTTYDGTWDLFPYVPTSIDYRNSAKAHSFDVWDGDFDYGHYDAVSFPTQEDTDDANSPNTVAGLPTWAQNSSAVGEGVSVGYNGSTGNPPDDFSSTPFRRSPSVQYDVTDPSGVRYTNTNPSGNTEWELYRIETDPALKNNSTQSDAGSPGPLLPAGVYQVHIDGMDLSNLSAMRFEYDILGVDSNGNPVKPLLPYNLGDTVYNDANRNGVQDSGETGIANVAVTLLDDSGNMVDSATTNASGQYLFNVDTGEWSVRVEPRNFLAGGALSGLFPTTGSLELTSTVMTTNDYAFDFGLAAAATGSVGDFIWLDVDGDGVQDANEPGLGGVTVTLTESGSTLSQTTTDVNGFYLFDGLDTVDPHTYTVTLTGTALTGLTPTYDSDGVATTPRSSTVTVAAGASSVVQDFGFRGAGTIGDFVWNEQSTPANTVYDPGTDIGIANVRVVLTWDGNGDGSVDMLMVTNTDAQGFYRFAQLPPATSPGNYRVRIDTNSLPFGMITVYDPDGTSTPGYATLTLAAGASNLAQDFGFRGEGSIGDVVWYDQNANGVHNYTDSNGNGRWDVGETGEPGIANVAVTLTGDYNNDGSADYTATAFTNANGIYSFTNLPSGRYTVTVASGSARTAWTATYDLDGVATPHTASATLQSRQSNQNFDFGYNGFTASPASLGDFVWSDANANGLQDSGESGLAGVTVSLYTSSATLVSTQTTGASGKYFFGNLTPGTYYVQFTAPSGYLLSAKLQGSDATKDSDADPTDSGKTAQFTLTAGQNLTTIDAGAYQTASVGDYVWNDANRDGTQGSDESGISGATVRLFTAAGVQVGSSVTTPASGAYSFSGLAPGSYYVQVTLPAGYGFTPKLIGTDATIDSDADPADSGKTAQFTLAAGQTLTTIDAGGFQGASVGDLVWTDTNGDGIQTGESGLANVTVSLYTAADVLVSTTTTGAGGAYSFSGLVPGSYYVQFVLPSGYSFTVKDKATGGGNDTNDSDANTTTGKTDAFTLVAGQALTTVDAGLVVSTTTGSIGNLVWIDQNGNGLQDTGEAGLGGVTVRLLNSVTLAQVGSSTTTDSSGFYGFTTVSAGSYIVEFSLPTGYVFSAKDVTTGGGNDTNDSDANTGTGRTDAFTMAAGENRSTVDAGAYAPASVGDFVWVDANGNGIQEYTDDNGNGTVDATDGNGRWDSGEPGEGALSGAQVALFRASDNTQVGSSFTTTATGLYSFTNLISGTYYVQFTLPAGYAFSPQSATVDTSRDSDAIVSTGRTAVFTLAGGDALTTLDAGAYRTASVGDFVWNDTNQNGLQDGGETGLAGATVKLLNSSGTQVGSTVTTTASGAYSFSGLAPGTYSLLFTPPSGYLFSGQDLGSDTVDSDVSPANGATAAFTLVGGDALTTFDAGASITAGGSIGNFVWRDTNNNGVQDSGETGLTGVTVKLYNAATNLQVGSTITTTSTGAYTFSGTGVDAGSYYVQFTLPSGNSFAAQNVATGTSATDSDVNPSTGKTATFTLGRGQVRTDIDAGAAATVSTAQIGNQAFYDVNGNGVHDYTDTNANGVWDSTEAGEPGLAGVTAKLYNATTNAQVGGTVTTSATGTYSFTSLAAGSYYVKFTLPTTAAYAFSPMDQGGNDSLDSDANASTGQTATFTLGNGQSLTTLDVGGTYLGSIGEVVWYDYNRDGIQQTTEQGLAGVSVTLVKPDGTTQAATTSSTGAFLFSNLRPGTYSVVVNASTISTAVIPANSRYRTYDFDDFTTTPDVATYTLGVGEDATFLNFGYSTGPLAYFGPRYRTYGHSSWGSLPSGNNTGTRLHRWFTTVYPSGVTIGYDPTSANNRYLVRWTTASAVTSYLPHLTSALKKLSADATNPITTSSGVLGSQLLGAHINRDFSTAGASTGFRTGLGSLKYNKAGHPFNGKTVDAIIDMADKYVGNDNQPFQGQGLPSTPTASQIAQALADINRNFINGNSDKGMLIP